VPGRTGAANRLVSVLVSFTSVRDRSSATTAWPSAQVTDGRGLWRTAVPSPRKRETRQTLGACQWDLRRDERPRFGDRSTSSGQPTRLCLSFCLISYRSASFTTGETHAQGTARRWPAALESALGAALRDLGVSVSEPRGRVRIPWAAPGPHRSTSPRGARRRGVNLGARARRAAAPKPGRAAAAGRDADRAGQKGPAQRPRA
jgi:hypothetical protein